MGTFYVNDTDGNDGTGEEDNPARPFKTIGAAIAAANTDGDIVEITDEATYDDESANIPVAANNITLIHTASELGRPIIDASTFGSTPPIDLRNGGTRTGFVIDGIEIKGSSTSGADVFRQNSGANSNGMVIFDCFIYGYDALSTQAIGAASGQVFRIESSSIMFEGRGGVAISLSNSHTGKYLIQNCFITRSFNSSGAIIDAFNRSTNTTASFCTFIYNNRVTNSTHVIKRFGKVINCVVSGSGLTSAGVTTLNGIDALDHSFNIVNGCANPFQDGASSNDDPGTGDLTDAVTFVNGEARSPTEATINSYVLQEGSAGTLAGTSDGDTVSGVNSDIFGTPRPQGIRVDMGAFETLSPYWSDEGQQIETKFGPNSFEIRATKNRLATRSFPAQKDNRQAPYYVTIAGPPTLRGQTPGGKPYKNET